MNKVKALTDESGHWYLIPNELADEFNNDLNASEEDTAHIFDHKWGKYMVNGDLNNVQLYIESDKTRLRWLQELPEPYHTQAVINTPNGSLSDVGHENRQDALVSAFDWENSPEGHAYWMDVWCTADEL